MKNIILTVVMLISFGMSCIAQITLNVGNTTFDVNHHAANFSINITADTGMAIKNLTYYTHTFLDSYTLSVDAQSNNQQVAGVLGGISSTLPYLNMYASINNTNLTVYNNLYLCPHLGGGWVFDTVYCVVSVVLEDIGNGNTMVQDTTLKVPLTQMFFFFPTILYQCGNVHASSGDWANVDTTGTGSIPGAWMFVRQGGTYGTDLISPIHILNDTTINVWKVLSDSGVVDSCVSVVLSTGESWCIWHEEVICKQQIAQPTLQLFTTASSYVNGGFSIDSIIINGGCWMDQSYPFIEDMCGNKTYLAGAGGQPNNNYYEMGWLGWWRVGQVFTYGGDTMVYYSNIVNYLPIFQPHTLSGEYEIFRDPFCTGVETKLHFTLYNNCQMGGATYVVTNQATNNLFPYEGTDSVAGWWKDSTALATTHWFEVENSIEQYTIGFNLGNCTTAASQPETLEEIGVFPNPTSGKVHVTGLPIGSSITITDALGRTVLEDTGTIFDLSQQSAGLYFVQVNTPKGKQTFKVIKE